MDRTSLALASLGLAIVAVVFGDPVERLLVALFLGLPAAFFLPLYAAQWITDRLTGQARYRP
jgi:hypothetical protein